MKKIALVILFLMLTSCASNPEAWRNFDTDDLTVSIFIGSIKAAKHIARPGPKQVCPDPPDVNENGDEMICVVGYRDPPPIKLTIELEEQIYGADLGLKFFVNTTSHFGLNSFNIGKEHRYLMIVLSDGVTNILPRYHFEPVNERDLSDRLGTEIKELDNTDLYALPLADLNDEVYWLPCDSQIREKVIVKEGKVGLYTFYNQAKEEPDYDDELFYRKATIKELIKEHRSLILKDSRYHFKDKTLYKRTYALSIKELKERLNKYSQEQMLEAYERETECGILKKQKK